MLEAEKLRWNRQMGAPGHLSMSTNVQLEKPVLIKRVYRHADE